MYLGTNKLTKILVCLLFVTFRLSGQTGESQRYRFDGTGKDIVISRSEHSISIAYSLPELAINNISNSYGSFYRLSATGHSFTTEPGKPELPVMNRLISIPEGASWRIRISDVKSTLIMPYKTNIKRILYPAQYGETKQKDPVKEGFILDKKAYSADKPSSIDTVSIVPLGKLRGNKLYNLIISPACYNPLSNTIGVITSMNIEIIFSDGINVSTKSSSDESALFNESIDKGILNYYPSDLITGFSTKPVEMVIVTDTSFKKYIQPFLKWKRQKGFKLDVLYVGAESAGTTYTEIKESISKIYKSSAAGGHPPEYLLIIGDAEKVPYFGTLNVTDMYYGEFDGNGDYIPDMYIGRIPASDTNSVKSALRKIIEYENFQFADTNTFYSRALAFAGKDAGYAPIMNGQIKYVTTNYLTAANKINEYHFYYPEGSTKKDSIMKLIQNGLSFINYTGHGSSAGWLHVDIKSTDVKNFGNKSMYPFVISNACRTAQFNDTSSLGNKMLLSSNKGAIGFIGCTNDSYWDEDFAWAVGPGKPFTDPTYLSTGLGALDRLFHSHNELPSDWYVTMGQVNFAGNLAVSSTSSLRKKYYWETYELIGDPSVIPIIGKPSKFTSAIPDTLPRGIRSLSLSIDPFSYIAISNFDTLWDATFGSPSGSAVLDLPVVSGDSCLIVMTGQNKIPLIKTIYFSKINKEYINLSGTEINDTYTNNNGKADFGETIYLKLRISNLGLTAASNLSATISSSSPWATITNNVATIGTLGPASETVINNVLQLKIADDIPDMGIMTIDLVLKDNKTEKKYKIDITVHAPQLEIVNCIIDDSLNGNNNFIAEPGESFNLVFKVMNSGTASTSGQFNIHSQENELEIIDPDVKSGVLQFGETAEISIPVKLSESARYGDFVSLAASLNCSPFIVNKDFSLRVGKVRESFESSTFNVFPWINVSTKPWTISASSSVDGSLSARSGLISHNSTSALVIRTSFSSNDSIKFHYKVSSEPNYDYFQFKLNGNEVLKKSGETNWESISVKVPEGYNKFEWIYRKDNSVSQGADGVWVDLIDFSGSATVNYIRKDIELARMVTPKQKEVYGQEPVSVKVLNVGKDTINSFNLAYSINGRMPVIQNFKTSILPFRDSVLVTFDRRADMDLSGVYNISVFGYENDDDYLLNDTLSVNFENTEIEESVHVYPNPFVENLTMTVNSKSDRKVKIALTNVSGKTVLLEEKMLSEGENSISINTNRISAGMYILNIAGPSYLKSFPVVKLRH